MAQASRTPDSTETNIFWLKPQQVEAMRDAAHEGRHGHRDEAIVTMLYDCGLRRGELAGLDRDMLDLQDRVLMLPGGIQKGYPNDGGPDAETIALDPEGELRTVRTLQAYLSAVDRSGSALFESQKSDRITGKCVNDVVGRLAERAGVSPHTHGGRGDPGDVTSHSLRHSVAYRFLRAYDGYSLYRVSQRLRHSRLSTTEQRYSHFDTV